MSVLKRPITTEKVQKLSQKGQYAFEVDLKANKIEIARAVEQMYAVTVTDVNTMRQIGKAKSRMSRGKISNGKTSTYKKAIVSLKEGEIIDFYADL